MSPTTTSILDSTRAHVAELERDRARLSALLEDADDRMRLARSGDDQELRSAAQEWAGLREVAADIAKELDATRNTLQELEAAAERERQEAELAEALRAVDECESEIIKCHRAALEAALAALRPVADLRVRRAQAHSLASALQQQLGLGRLRDLQEPRPEAVLRNRADYLPEDEVAYATFTKLVNHPALTTPRAEVLQGRAARREHGRMLSQLAAWDARANMLEEMESRAVPSTSDDRVALRRWLEENPREALT